MQNRLSIPEVIFLVVIVLVFIGFIGLFAETVERMGIPQKQESTK